MYYEEHVFDGKLMCRSHPDGPWVLVDHEKISQRLILAEARLLAAQHDLRQAQEELTVAKQSRQAAVMLLAAHNLVNDDDTPPEVEYMYSEREAVLLGVIQLVRNYPDFDNGKGPIVEAMDTVLRGGTPKILGDIEYLRQGLKPPESVALGKLKKPAQVGAGRFSIGVSERLVVEAAQRLYEYETQPEREAERIAKSKSFSELLQSGFEPSPETESSGAGMVLRLIRKRLWLEDGQNVIQAIADLQTRHKAILEAVRWVCEDAAYKAPETIGPVAERWLERLRSCIDRGTWR